MSYAPVGFERVGVLRAPIAGNRMLYIVCGVAVISFQGDGSDWKREDVVFLVPQEGGGDLQVRTFQSAVVSAYPATVESHQGEISGWGVDYVDADTDGAGHVRVTARTVVRNSGGALLRMGFQANILGAV